MGRLAGVSAGHCHHQQILSLYGLLLPGGETRVIRVALAAGIADGLGYGDNTKAALITRGITEIARLGTAMGGKFETFCGLAVSLEDAPTTMEVGMPRPTSSAWDGPDITATSA